MALTRAQLYKATWIVMAGSFVKCERCGGEEPPPVLPCPLDALDFYMLYVAARHYHCTETPS